MVRNIVLAGVGGQGLVLATRIISEAAFRAGYDVKTNDVIGLSQRGGRVWGSVRYGNNIYSPNIPPGQGDMLLGLEPLEAYRWTHLMKEGAYVIINEKVVYPTPVLLEEEEYPYEEIDSLRDKFNVIRINARDEAKMAGNIKAANAVMLGLMARYLEIDTDIWEEVLRENVPSKDVEANITAFYRGYNK
ncbi:MAG TPA: indolepyruvate oxidoreductase subunit beta [Tissierellia bacterium]|nr:indolepyruvate oxidoreductase subunit beta [Tissierellia bacterium]